MKILLMCGAGASSGFMAQAMRKAAKAQNMEDIEIIARSDAEMMNNLKGTDLTIPGGPPPRCPGRPGWGWPSAPSGK